MGHTASPVGRAQGRGVSFSPPAVQVLQAAVSSGMRADVGEALVSIGNLRYYIPA